ncbi:hypothetical protein L0U88_15145 [Flavihumibacter sp. RY-1]|uniref:Uncharacterized protein n=1 Tax=Flavihumibacter fluminis TaxID=2909236 RepID=A0ABS9BKV3_9BACT|nr:hypothetical protein [Flavihumibacter fluminis]MCF1715975.1 hypothetical protein [Flavihumibacter fluminis]
MITVEKKLSTSGLSDYKQKARQIKKVLSESIIVGILTFFGIILLLILSEKFKINIPTEYSKLFLIGLSTLNAIIYYLRGINKFNKHIKTIKTATEHTFRITDYYFQFISNTEYVIYACKTTDNKTVIFQTSELPTNELLDTLVIDIIDDKIIKIDNYSTGQAVNQHKLDNQLIDKYEKEFYILENAFYNL